MEDLTYTLEFEKPLRELEKQLITLRQVSQESKVDVRSEIKAIEAKIEKTKKEIYSNLGAWQRVQLSRHPKRPYSLDYIDLIFTDLNSTNKKIDKSKLTNKPTCIIVGPEGDFSKLEREKILTFKGVQTVKINENIFQETTRYSNVYNRMIAYDSCEFHRANSFDTNSKNRLTIVGFINGIEMEEMPLERVRKIGNSR